MTREEFNSLKHNTEIVFKKTSDIMDDNVENDKNRYGESYFFRHFDESDKDLCYCAESKEETDEKWFVIFYIDEIELV